MTETNTPKIGFIGECMIELQKDNTGMVHQKFAGDTYNTAVYLSRLLPQSSGSVHYITALGQDTFSDAMMSEWQSENIHCDWVRRFEDKLPGLYYVNVDAQGERSFLYWRDQAAARDLLKGVEFDSQLEKLTEFDYLYLSGVSLAILSQEHREKLLGLLSRARKNGCKVCFDNNFRPTLWKDIESARHWYQQQLSLTDIAFLTGEDEELIWGSGATDDIFNRCAGYGIGEVVIKRGVDPCLIRTSQGQFEVPAVALPAERVIDTNAAGDSFSAGYMAARIADNDEAVTCAARAHRLASTVIQHRGAIIPRDAMKELMA
jgi:2-dehydro-3-deoxygluconokinase